MPYGQEVGSFNPQLAEAIANQERLRWQQQQAQNMMTPTGGAGGKTDMITALLGGFMSGRANKKIAQGDVDIRQQIADYQQQQAQAQEAKAQQMLEDKRNYQKQMLDEKRLYQQKQAEIQRAQDIEDRNYQIQQTNANRTYGEDLYDRRLADKRAYNEANKPNNQQGMYTPQEQAIIRDNPQLEEQIKQKKINEAIGKKEIPISAGERKKAKAKDELKSTMKNLYNHVKKWGTEYGGDKGATLKTAYGDFFMKYKTAEDLGAIQGADERLVKNIIDDPSSFGNQFNPFKGSNTLASLEEYAKLQGWDFTKDEEEQAPKTTQPLSRDQVKNTNDLVNFYTR